jgi:hypothetical protein
MKQGKYFDGGAAAGWMAFVAITALGALLGWGLRGVFRTVEEMRQEKLWSNAPRPFTIADVQAEAARRRQTWGVR